MQLFFKFMLLKNVSTVLLLFTIISCNEGSSNNKLIQTSLNDTIFRSNFVDTPMATWASNSIHSFQILELKDSFNATIYYYVDAYTNPNKMESPYYFKAKAKVALWNQNQMTVKTDKYNFYYDIWRDTLILKDEAGIQEKLIRVYNDTVMRNQ
jgi:hypothetical protein